MVGTLKPLAIDPSALERMRQHPETREALDAVGLTEFDGLRSWFTAARTRCARSSATGRC